MSAPSVSIIVPAYNREVYISDALASLQTQSGVDADIIVVDDGSTDGTIDVIREIATRDNRVRLIQTAHGGVARARNVGLCAARGDYVTFLDSDDLCAPDRLARQIAKLRDCPAVTVVLGHSRWFTEITADFRPVPGSLWYRRTDPILSSAMFRPSVFDEFGTFDERLEYAEDMDLFFRLFEADAKILVEVEVATYYRIHPSNMTKDEAAMYKGLLQAYHRSIKRRRQSGRMPRLNVFFHRPFDEETVISGLRTDDLLQGHHA